MLMNLGKLVGAIILGFFGAGAILIGIVWLFASAFAQEVQPTRPARLSDANSPDIYRPNTYATADLTSVDMILATMPSTGTSYDCKEHNDSIVYKVGYIAQQITKAPKYGYFFTPVLVQLAIDLDEDCL